VAHLCVFGATAYAHIFPDLYLSKLRPRVTQLTLIGYFGAGSYKLLDQETGSVYSGRNVRFEEGTANLTKGPQQVEWSGDNDPLPPKVLEEQVQDKGKTGAGEESVDGSGGVSTETDKENRVKIGGGNRLVEEDISRDVGGAVVSEDEVEGIVWVEDPVETVGVGGGTVRECVGVAISRQRREPKPSHRLLESKEYLG